MPRKTPHEAIRDRLQDWAGPDALTTTQVKSLIWSLAQDPDLERDLAKEVADARRETGTAEVIPLFGTCGGCGTSCGPADDLCVECASDPEA